MKNGNQYNSSSNDFVRPDTWHLHKKRLVLASFLAVTATVLLTKELRKMPEDLRKY